MTVPPSKSAFSPVTDKFGKRVCASGGVSSTSVVRPRGSGPMVIVPSLPI
jgi:hypothetical protein